LRRQRHRGSGPIAGATEEEMAVSLGTVFILNSVALFLFPPIGFRKRLLRFSWRRSEIVHVRPSLPTWLSPVENRNGTAAANVQQRRDAEKEMNQGHWMRACS